MLPDRAELDDVRAIVARVRQLGWDATGASLIVYQRYRVAMDDFLDLFDLTEGQAADLNKHLQELLNERNRSVIQ